MNRYTRLPLLAFGLLLAAGCSDLFHEEGLDGMRPDDRVGDLVATRAVEDDGDSLFPTGSLYRLFAFTQTYDEVAPDTYDPATMLRFDQLASEQETGEANHKYIKVANVNTDFSFNPSNDREKADDPSAKRTIDFYGFTYAFLDNNKAGFTLDISRTLMGGFTGSKFFQNIATATVNSCKDFYVSADCPFETSIGETKLELKDADLFANPGAGDFRVKPTEYAAFGDPRWEK